MHLWPSMRLRDSFKIGYLKKLEWNLHRMNSEKRSQAASGNNNRQRLLDSEQKHGVVNGGIQEEGPISATPSYSSSEKAAFICGDHDSEQKHGVVNGGIQEEGPISATPSYSSSEKAAFICGEILMILSCCYCCFCCGACVEDDV